jgi:Mrp family chromosome partitioning ATPase
VASGRRRVADLLKVRTLVKHYDTEDGYEVLPDFIAHDDTLNIDILALTDDDRMEFSGAQHAQSIIDRLRSNYQVILVDTGTLASSGGAYWLAHSDYRILVIDSTITTREMLQYQRKESEHASITLNGSILNKRKYPIPKSLYWLAR